MSLTGALAGRPAWVVGGTIRDELLGRETKDVDVALAGDPEPAALALAQAIRGPVFALSEKFGAWRVIDRRGGVVYDLSPLQGETIEEDLARRDFSINAMARPARAWAEDHDREAADHDRETAAPGDLIDPTGGRADLDRGVLRVLGARAYDEDPLRTLRLARFAAELGLTPDPETERLTLAAAPRLREVSGERIFAELKRLLIAPHAVEGMGIADRLGLLRAVLPELADLHDIEQSQYHHKDVYGHTLEVLEQQIQLERDAEAHFGAELGATLRAVLDEPLADELTRWQALRFGALVHDIGKPETRGVRPDGRVTFVGHDARGEEMVRVLCRRLRTSERLARFLEGLTRHHLVLGFLVHRRPLSRRDVYRYLARTTPVEVEVTVLSCADRLATRGRKADEAIAAHLELGRELIGPALRWRAEGPPAVPLRGDELAAELGIPAGPELGELLAQLREDVYAGEVTTREQAVEHARRLRHDSGT